MRRTLEFGIVGQIVSATGCRSRVLRALSAAGEVDHREVLATKVGRRVGDIRARRPSWRVHCGILKRKSKGVERREKRYGMTNPNVYMMICVEYVGLVNVVVETKVSRAGREARR